MQTVRWSRRAGRFDHELHGDGLLKFQSGTHELFHLTVIILQLFVALAVGQVEFFEAGEFDLKFLDLFEGEMGESGLRFASKNLADEEREGAAMREHGSRSWNHQLRGHERAGGDDLLLCGFSGERRRRK